MRTVLLFSLLLAATACTAPAEDDNDDDDVVPSATAIDAADFEQRCDSDDDCVAVFSGEMCDGTCTCENDAVATSAFDAWRAAYDAVTCERPDCDCHYFGSDALCVDDTCTPRPPV